MAVRNEIHFLITSGDIQYGVPTIVVRKLSVFASCAQKPKSVSLTIYFFGEN